eukprot:scaffold1001_cov334-Prasinococcus_capsulatus_cf.AAC.18
MVDWKKGHSWYIFCRTCRLPASICSWDARRAQIPAPRPPQPVASHQCQLEHVVAGTFVCRTHLEGRADAEPAGKVEACLSPGEDPRDGAQRADVRPLLAAAGAAADVQIAQFRLRRGLSKRSGCGTPHSRISRGRQRELATCVRGAHTSPTYLAIGPARGGRHLLHYLADLLAGLALGGPQGDQLHRRRVDLELPDRDAGNAELGLHHLPLLSDSQRSHHRAPRLPLHADRQRQWTHAVREALARGVLLLECLRSRRVECGRACTSLPGWRGVLGHRHARRSRRARGRG